MENHEMLGTPEAVVRGSPPLMPRSSPRTSSSSVRTHVVTDDFGGRQPFWKSKNNSPKSWGSRCRPTTT